MLSFYQKLAMKLNDGGGIAGAPAVVAVPGKAVSYNAAGVRKPYFPAAQNNPADGVSAGAAASVTDTSVPAGASPAALPEEPMPDGAEPLGVDLYQSESRVVIFVQASGISAADFDIVADEEANTLTIQATQKRPDLPPLPGVKPGEPSEKGRFAKQEVKWNMLYRKVYLPMPFDGGESQAFLMKGVLVVLLPGKKPGVGKKLAVKEIVDEKQPA